MVKSAKMSSWKKMNNYPNFFKFFLPTITDHRLRIPREFLKHMEGKFCGTVSLMGPNRNIWHVVLIESPDGVFLEDGWHDFVKDHSVQVGYCLIFRYDGNLHFTVQIFDTSACNKEYDSNVKPCNDSISFGDLNKKKHGDNDAKVLDGSSCKVCKGSFKNPMGKKNHPAIRPAPQTQHRKSYTAPKVQPSSLLERKPNIKNMSKKAPGRSSVTVYVSQRRPVKTEEIKRALENAKSFKSENHFAVVVMQRIHVYRGFAVRLPLDFVRAALPESTQIISLYVPNRNEAWEVKCITCNNICRRMLSAGWCSFSVSNNLEHGDVCVFEVIAHDKLRVHIFRVVDEITPLIRRSLKYTSYLRLQRRT